MDRMEVIHLSGYTEDEKKNIAYKHLIQKVSKANGFEAEPVPFEDEGLVELIRHYTREAGVRNLERELSSVCRKLARSFMQVATESEEKNKDSNEKSSSEKLSTQIKLENIIFPNVNSELVQKLLGVRRFSFGERERTNEIGMSQGLAYTEAGGDLLVTEVAVMSGKGNLKVTGKLGEVMQESAQAAFSYVRSRAMFLGLEEDFYSKIDIHVHFPEGAIPKDGPSAGITIATALVSALTKHPFNKEVAMTGEITLRGKVLPIGGLKEKLLAAHRGGINKVLIPQENEKDLEEIPLNIKESLTIIPVDHVDTVLLHALKWDNGDALEAKLKVKVEEVLPQLQQVNLQVLVKH